MKQESITIRESKPSDFEIIMEVEKEAFGYDKEARLVADLLSDKSAEPILSLLAFHGEEPVGHILFTRAWFEQSPDQPLMHILAPLAVKPHYQRKGIGGMLIKEGLSKLKEAGSEIVFVLGHKEYYPKYGFIPHAVRAGFAAPFLIPDEAGEYWMYQYLSSEKTQRRGKVICADTLNKPEHWRDDESDR